MKIRCTSANETSYLSIFFKKRNKPFKKDEMCASEKKDQISGNIWHIDGLRK